MSSVVVIFLVLVVVWKYILNPWVANWWAVDTDRGDLRFAPAPIGSLAHTLLEFKYPGNVPVLDSKNIHVRLLDGDIISTDMDSPIDWDEKSLVVLVHGLAGSSRSTYMVQLAKALVKAGHCTVRVNLRGSGSGHNLATWPYHAGRSHDIREVLLFYHTLYPNASMTLVGYSLGGNIVLKCGGEIGKEFACHGLARIVSICPSADLPLCSKKLEGFVQRRIFGPMFVAALKYYVRQFEGKPHFEALREGKKSLDEMVPAGTSIREFDSKFTAPLGRFASVEEYYSTQSARQVLEAIAVPTTILFAPGDPLIACEGVCKTCKKINNPSIRVVLRSGGHCAFLPVPFTSGGRDWLARQVVSWVSTAPF